MFMKYKNTMFLHIMMMSTIMAVSSSSWLNAWLCFEINMMSFLPLIASSKSSGATSSSIKYFLVQAMSSMVMLLAVMVLMKLNFVNMMNMNNEIMLLAMCMKSGIPPMHFWIPQVLEGLGNVETWVMLSIQKIAPFALISYLSSSLMVPVVMLSALVGAVGGYKQSSLKKILVYSSMTHGAWMLTAMMMKSTTWVVYFLIYSMSTMFFCVMMEKMQLKTTPDLMNGRGRMKQKFVFLMNMMSMGGMPPFMGFAAKLLVLKSVSLQMVAVPSILLAASLMSIYYYLEICFSTFLLNEKQIFFYSKTEWPNVFILSMLILNLFIPMLVCVL